MLKYNFFGVGRDQFWYFGPWSRNSRILTFQDVSHQLLSEGILRQIFIVMFLVLLYRRVSGKSKISLNQKLILVAGTILFAGGFLSSFAGHSGPYFWPFRKWTYMVSLVLILAIFSNLIRKYFLNSFLLLGATRNLSVVMAILISISLFVGSLKSYQESLMSIRQTSNFSFSPSLGGYLDNSYSSLARKVNGQFIEEYFGIVSSVNGPRNEFKVDSVIHALGLERSNFTRTLQKSKPKFVFTTNPDMSKEWVSWNISANYFLYRPLFRSYIPEILTPTIIRWKKSFFNPSQPIACKIENGEIFVSTDSARLIEVSLVTKTLKNRRNFVMVRNNIQVAENAKGYLTLDPNETGHVFPALINVQNSSLDFKSLNSPDVDQYAQSCTAKSLGMTALQNQVYLPLFQYTYKTSTGANFE
jgi:hypothetical protein